MDLLDRILNCQENEVENIMDEAIKNANENSTKVDQLGFISGSLRTKTFPPFKGFIPLNTRIKYSSMNIETYKMDTTDFFYDFARFIREKNIRNKNLLVACLSEFFLSYFGCPGENDREAIFQDRAWNNSTTDDEFFEALENNRIGDLKGLGAAQCTEYGAVVQQLLSLFLLGDCYYCIGCVDLGDRQEPHCFNIVKTRSGYVLLDSSVPANIYNPDGTVRGYLTYLQKLSNEEFLDFINNGIVKTFDSYDYNFENGKNTKVVNGKRSYVVGAFEINKENSQSIKVS